MNLFLNKSRLYYAFRNILLTSVLFFSLLWFIFGFDSTLAGLVDPKNQGIGIHWSSLQTFFITWYLIVLNYSVDGIKSFQHLKEEIKLDFRGLTKVKEVREFMSGRVQKINGLMAFVYGFLLGAFAFAVFEVPYVFALNFFHFNSLLFPTYMYNTDLVSFAFVRNFMFLLLPPFIFWFITKNKGFKYNFNINAVFLICVTILIGFNWIIYPSDVEIVTAESLGLEGNYTFPRQELFRQTVYTYLNVPVNTYHNDSNLNGWHQEDTVIHSLNTLTKYAVFFTVTYICMARFVSIEVKES